jgi:hypothetical protein
MVNKKILLGVTVIAMLTLSVGVAWADEVTSEINYQGRLADSAGGPLTGTYTMTFRLYEAATGGTALDTDTHSVAVENRLFNTEIDFDQSYFDGRALWLGIKVGTDSEMTPRQEFRPMPYALSLVPGARIVGDTSGPALRIENKGDGGRGVYGSASNTGDTRNYGGYFVADGSRGRGIYGKASNTGDAINYGGFFYASGVQGRGVFGQAAGSSGYGVKGWASDDGDVENYGGHFCAAGNRGIGVYGWAESEGSGENYGGYFVAEGDNSRGVAAFTSGDYSDGVYVKTTGKEGGGVYVKTTGYNSEGIYVETTGEDAEGVYVKTTGEEAEGFYAYTTGVGSEGVYAYSEKDVGVRSNGKTYDFYAGGPGTNYGPFTGAHEVKLSADFPENVTPGMIVSFTGETQIRQIDGRNISFSSTLPTVQLSDTPDDSKVLGVLISESPLPEEHWYINDSIEGDRFGIVNALGEGRVWVTDINGDIEAGDYITTSLVAGYGQKQDDDLLHSYTLGKAIESVNWGKLTTTVEFNGQTCNAYPIAVVYTSG